jgi:hypothetical protein
MRLKIIAGSLGVVVLMGLAGYLAVRGQLRSELLVRIDDRIASERELAERSFRLSAIEFTDLVARRAGERQMRDVFGGLDLASRRTRAYEAAEAAHAWFADPARGERGGPDIVVIVDETGTAIARNGARNVMFGTLLPPSLPILSSVLREARAAHDAWLEPQHGKVLQTALAPIRSEAGTTLGALIVGYDLSNGVAQRAARLLGRDVAFIVDGKVYSASVEGGAAKALRDFLFGPQATATRAVLAGQQRFSEAWVAVLGDEYVGMTSRLPLAPAVPVAFAVLGNRSAQLALADVANVILVLTVLGALLVALYGFMMGNALMRPIEEIEEGVLAVINGRTDLRLEIDSAELGGLAFRINQLLNVVTGTDEETEDERGKISVRPSRANWSDAELSDAQSPAAAAAAPPGAGVGAAGQDEPIEDAALARRLAGEEETAYGARVYREYVAAKEALGESVAGIPQDRFLQRLSGRGEALAKKFGCRAVRFHVNTQGGQVLLRPVLLR